MTNAAIIMAESIRLMEAGKLAGSGHYTTIDREGKQQRIELPEEIHTYNGWKSRGFQVKKGQKSEIRIRIWKHVTKAKKEEDLTGNPLIDAPLEHMIVKEAAFFTAAQVEPAKSRL